MNLQTDHLSLEDPFPIRPFTKPLKDACVELPGSKSITNRALILAALCCETVTLENVLFSRDTSLMIAALRALGFTIKADDNAKSISVKGLGGQIPKAKEQLNVGNAGTVARFLTAFLSLKQNGEYYLDGDLAMRTRPIKGLLDALESCGAAQATFHEKQGCFPFTLKTNGFPGGEIKVDAKDSSQILSALLMVAPFGKKETQLIFEQVRTPFVAMTLSLMKNDFGMGDQLSDLSDSSRILVPCVASYKRPSDGRFFIEPDATAASYFASLPIVSGGSILLKNYTSKGSIQGDNSFLESLQAHGFFNLEGLPDASTRVSAGASKKGIAINFNLFSDTFLTFAALSLLFEGTTSIAGIAHTRHQETDRVHGMATELKKLLGLNAINESPDGLTITSDIVALKKRFIEKQASGERFTIDTYQDHRFAMSFAILGCYDLLGNGEPWLQINDPGCCRKTFPSFFQKLDDLNQYQSRPF